MRRLKSAVALGALTLDPSPGVDEIVRAGSSQSLRPYRQVPIDWIETDSGQPRQFFDPEKLESLVEDIRLHQIDTPLFVRTVGPERFLLIAGERRLRAARMAGLATVPILVRDDLTPENADLLRLRENLQREELSPIETARGIKNYKELSKKTWEEIAAEFGWKKPTILEKIRLLDAPEPVQALIEENRISPSHYTALAALPEEQQVHIATRAADERLSTQEVRQMRDQVQKNMEKPRHPLPQELRSLGTQTPQEDEKPDGDFKEQSSLGTQTPQSTLSDQKEKPRSQRGANSAEVRFYTTPDYQLRLRHIAADLSNGSVSQLSKQAMEWLADYMAEGNPAPWLPRDSDA